MPSAKLARNNRETLLEGLHHAIFLSFLTKKKCDELFDNEHPLKKGKNKTRRGAYYCVVIHYLFQGNS